MLGVIIAVMVTDFIRKERQSLPVTFWISLVVSLVELWLWLEVARQPGYQFTVESSLPVGAFYFFFTWASDAMMRRTVIDAFQGVKRGEKLVEVAHKGKHE